MPANTGPSKLIDLGLPFRHTRPFLNRLKHVFSRHASHPAEARCQNRSTRSSAGRRTRIGTDKRAIFFYPFRDARNFLRRRRKRLYCYGLATFPLNPRDAVGLGLGVKYQRSLVYLSDLLRITLRDAAVERVSNILYKSIICKRVFLGRVSDGIGEEMVSVECIRHRVRKYPSSL